MAQQDTKSTSPRIRLKGPDGKLYTIPQEQSGAFLRQHPDYDIALAEAPAAAAGESKQEPDTTLAQYPGKVLDRIGANLKGLPDTVTNLLQQSRAGFREAKGKGDVAEMALAIPRAYRNTFENLVKGTLGVTAPGLAIRSAQGEKPENLVGDVAMGLLPGGEDAAAATHTPIDPTRAGSIFGAETRGKSMLDRVDVAAKGIPVNWRPAYEWAQRAIELGKRGFTIPKPISDFVAWIDSRIKSGMEKVSGEPGARMDRGAEEPLLYEHARDFEKALGAKIPWDEDTGGVMGGYMKKMRESLGQETATALRPHGLDIPYLRGKAEMAKVYGSGKIARTIGKYGGKALGYGTGGVVGHPLILGYAGGELGKSAAGSLVRSIVNAGERGEGAPIARSEAVPSSNTTAGAARHAQALQAARAKLGPQADIRALIIEADKIERSMR